MHLPSILLAMLAATTTAQWILKPMPEIQTHFTNDTLIVYNRIGKNPHRDHSLFYHHRTGVLYGFDGNDGCRRATNVPDMNYCLDYFNGRAHYFWGNEKRVKFANCLVRDRDSMEQFDGCDRKQCQRYIFRQTECTWLVPVYNWKD